MLSQNEHKVPEKMPATDNGETIKELADRHLHDKTHHTTDEEIKNAQIEFTDVEATELSDILEEDKDRK